MKLSELESEALHESAHAIAARQLRIPFTHVSMQPNESCLHVTQPVTWARRWEWLTVYCAGTAGNVFFEGYGWAEAWQRFGWIDLDYIAQSFGSSVLHDDDEFSQLVSVGEKRALQLLRDNQRGVEFVARGLLDSRSVSCGVVGVQLEIAHSFERSIASYRDRGL